MSIPTLPFHAVYHSADHVRLIAANLSVNDLLTTSTLSRSSPALFDREAVWQDRLKAAEAVQHVDVDDDAEIQCEDETIRRSITQRAIAVTDSRTVGCTATAAVVV